VAERALFDVPWLGGRTARQWRSAIGELDAAFPWETLQPERWSDADRLHVQLTWTEAAFNEWCTAAAMAQLVQAMVQAGAPLDLVGVASTFIPEELLHVELCARIAMTAGGGAPVLYDPDDLALDLDPGLSPLQRASDLVIRVCCVGEAFSLPMLAGTMRATPHPLMKAVLTRIVRDEAPHGQLGWDWMAWLGPALDDVERTRLAAVATDALLHVRDRFPAVRPARSAADEAHHLELGSLGPVAWRTQAEQALDEVVRRLGEHGVAVVLDAA
jgi:hypothetical protein